MKSRLAGLGLLILVSSTMQAPASPNCTLPYNLLNGQTADATQVMANYNAIIGTGCVGSAASAGANSDITSLSGLTSPLPSSGGGLNKFRNGTMDIWQRGTSPITVTTSGAYTADGWIVVPSGASASAQQAQGRQLTAYALQISGASGVTDIIVKQRIESVIAAALTSQTVTVQARIYNNAGASITPTLTVKHAGSADNWSSPIVDVNAASMQSASNGQWTQLAYTFTASSSSANGIEISFDFGNNFGSSSNTLKITEVDVRSTPGVSTGINSNPPPPELRPVGSELIFSQRYFQVIPAYWGVKSPSAFSANQINWFTPLRTTPTVAYQDSAGTASRYSSFAATNAITNGRVANSATPTANYIQFLLSNGDSDIAWYIINLTASAEL